VSVKQKVAGLSPGWLSPVHSLHTESHHQGPGAHHAINKPTAVHIRASNSQHHKDCTSTNTFKLLHVGVRVGGGGGVKIF
jgi:hypothetical protein